MIIKEEEKTKVNSSEIGNLERVLDEIELEKEKLIREFDANVQSILGPELINRLLEEKTFDDNGKSIPLFSNVIVKNDYGITTYSGILTSVHKSMINDPKLKQAYEEKLRTWFKTKTVILKKLLDHKEEAIEVNKYVPMAYALSSLALTAFHKNPNMEMRDVQFLAGIAISNGDIAELGTGEGKTLAAILPVYLHALRGKGVHVVTANSYLSKRDFEEVLPIFYGLGLDVGFVPEGIEELARIEGFDPDTITLDKRRKLEEKLKKIKQKSYRADITYGSKSAIAFDYLRDGIATKKEDLVQREEKPGFALIDEVDDALIDDAQSPYLLGSNLPIYTNNMTLRDLAIVLDKPYEDVIKRMEEAGINVKSFEKLSYEKARSIAVNLYSKELVPDSFNYQKRAQRFFEKSIEPRMYIVDEHNEFGINPDDLYDILTGTEKEIFNKDPKKQELIRARIQQIKDTVPVIYYPVKKEYKVTDLCYKEFLDYCYSAFQIRSVTKENERLIINDQTYVQKRDYNIVNGEVVLTMDGAKRIINDKRHPEFVNDYNAYINLVNPFASEILHYFDQALYANLIMRNLENYKVDNGVIKVVKNGRILEGANYSNGLHQALEFKEKINEENMTRENHTLATITQKDFYSRYDAFSGMTGTSSKSVFKEIFNKETVQIPRHPFYQFFSKRLKRKGKNSYHEPLGTEKKDTKFAIDVDTKIKLIVDSIKDSHKKSPKQPVLLVVSNPLEMEMLSNALRDNGIKHTMLSVLTDKAKEAEIIAKAGLPGAVTISTEMAGRGTDIKPGGDRQTIIDIATERHIKKVEEKLKSPLLLSPFEKEEIRKKVERALMNQIGANGKKYLWSKSAEIENRKALDSIGLKVISSGYFNVERIDKQLEGRTGRNGMKGITERFACPSDLEYLGINSIKFGSTVTEYFKKYPERNDHSIDFEPQALKKINDKIREVQSNNEELIGRNIAYTQELSRNATKIIEQYREKRRKILCGDIDLNLEIQSLFEDTIDNLLMSYVIDGKITPYNLLSSLSKGEIKIDLETFSLEAKEVLGVDIDLSSVKETGVNLLEFRNALLEYMIYEHNRKKEKDPIGQKNKDINALLSANSYALANIPNILNTSSNQKYLTAFSLGMEGQDDYYANKEFYHGLTTMRLEASKIATKQLIGITLNLDERKKLDEKKEKIFGSKLELDEDYETYEFSEPKSRENDFEQVTSLRDINEKIRKQDRITLEKAGKKATKALEKDDKSDISKFYSNLKIRPLSFVKALSETRESLKTTGKTIGYTTKFSTERRTLH